MTNLELFLQQSTSVWHNSIILIQEYGKSDLNALYKCGKIEVRNGLNVKVVKYVV